MGHEDGCAYVCRSVSLSLSLTHTHHLSLTFSSSLSLSLSVFLSPCLALFLSLPFSLLLYQLASCSAISKMSRSNVTPRNGGARRHLARRNTTPYTSHPTPYTLHPALYSPHPTPYILHLTPYTPHPTPYTLHPKPFTPALHAPPPTPCTLGPTFLRTAPYTRLGHFLSPSSSFAKSCTGRDASGCRAIFIE